MIVVIFSADFVVIVIGEALLAVGAGGWAFAASAVLAAVLAFGWARR